MPPLQGSRHAHENVLNAQEEAEVTLVKIQAEQAEHATVNGAALQIMKRHGIYSNQTAEVVTPWVYNSELENGAERTAYQLRTSNAKADYETFGTIELIVRVSRPNPINPNALITYEEMRGRINCPVMFRAGDVEFDTYDQQLGVGVENPRPATREQFPIGAMTSKSQTFIDIADTLSFVDQSLPA